MKSKSERIYVLDPKRDSGFRRPLLFDSTRVEVWIRKDEVKLIIDGVVVAETRNARLF